jgi:S1-C subfamily serine protease
MNALRMNLLAAGLVAAALPGLAAAAEPPPPAPGQAQGQAQDEKRLAEARARLEKATQEVAELSRQMGREFTMRFNTAGGVQPRSLLGVLLDSEAKKDGAHVREVSPGGAAAEAGIKAGDIITSIAGQDLTKETDPGRALVEKMGQIEPNLKVQVGVLREGRKLNFDVTPRPAPALAMAPFGGEGRGPDVPRLMQQLQERVRERQETRGGFSERGMAGGPGERRVEIRTLREGPDDGTRFAGLEFASVSEKLGGYFGVKSGVLVVRSGANSPMKLQDGDVILAIDGREPSSAQHAARILRSYSPGEKLTLRVQRDRKAQNVEITMPSDGREDVLIRGPAMGRGD